MDSFPAQPTINPVSSPAQTPPQQKRDLRKFSNLSSWIFLFAFLPITILIFLSQDTVPGDNFYPVKRGLENVILAAASVSPATRTAFKTDLTEARFKEAQSLVISKSNSSGLTTFIDEVQSTQVDVANLKSDTERGKAEEKLLAKIDQYQNSLSNLQTKTEQNLIAYSIQEVPTPTSISTPSPITNKILTPTPTPLPLSSSQLKSSPTPLPDGGFVPTSIPTLTPIPTVAQIITTVPAQQDNIQITQREEIVQSLKDTKEKLDRIKKDLEEKREENKNENIKRTVKDNEDENQNKNNPNKKTETSGRQK